jgi:hypothetical protein
LAVSSRFTERPADELHRLKTFSANRVEVMNFGVSTYGTMQVLQTIKQDIWPFEANLSIICLLTDNDFQNHGHELAEEPDKPYLEWHDGEFKEPFPELTSSSPMSSSRSDHGSSSRDGSP